MASKNSDSFSLSSRAMLVKLRQERWNNGSAADDETTQETLTRKHAEHDAGRFTKVLIPSLAMRPITSSYNAMRKTFRVQSLPWEEGVGIIRSEAWDTFSTRMGEHKTACEVAAREFAFKVYPTFADPKAAKARMGALYDAADFPTPAEVHAKYQVRVIVLPVPDRQDFRVSLGDEAMKGFEEYVTTKAKEAQKDLWARVLDVLQHFASTMKDSGAKFKDVTVTNLSAIAKDAEALAIMPDARLSTICRELAEMGKVLPDTLRTDDKARVKVAKDAAAAVARIETIMKGAF